MALPHRIFSVFLFIFLGASLYAKEEWIDTNYRKLCSGMSKDDIAQTLTWELKKPSLLWEKEDVRRQLAFLDPRHLLVFSPLCITRDVWLVIDLDDKDRLRNVFRVIKMETSQAEKSYNVEYLWPINGDYEKRLKRIKYGDNIKEVMGKIGWRPQTYQWREQKGENVVSFSYMIRGAMVLLDVNPETGRVVAIETISNEGCVQVFVDHEDVRFERDEEFYLRVRPPTIPQKVTIPQEYTIEIPDL